jgi:alanine dehydrogenase
MSRRPTPLIIAESDVGRFVTLEDAWRVIREVFEDVASEDALNFPVVRETLSASKAVFGVKSAQYRRYGVVGLKAGGYFPGNAARGDANHQSFVILLDQETGKPRAIVGGNLLTRLRTAASAALSIDTLARCDAKTLAVVGAGAQAETHIRAALLARDFDKILLWNRSKDRAAMLASQWTGSVPIKVTRSAEEAVRNADVVITLTGSTQAIVMAEWVKPGCHLTCMGADTIGKQEVDIELVRKARVVTDSVAQATSIGECQAAFRARRIGREDIAVLGDVLRGLVPGRRSETEVTLFDGTGVAAQDIAMAALVAERASGLA